MLANDGYLIPPEAEIHAQNTHRVQKYMHKPACLLPAGVTQPSITGMYELELPANTTINTE